MPVSGTASLRANKLALGRKQTNPRKHLCEPTGSPWREINSHMEKTMNLSLSCVNETLKIIIV